jgi:hypothetical protein
LEIGLNFETVNQLTECEPYCNLLRSQQQLISFPHSCR